MSSHTYSLHLLHTPNRLYLCHLLPCTLSVSLIMRFSSFLLFLLGFLTLEARCDGPEPQEGPCDTQGLPGFEQRTEEVPGAWVDSGAYVKVDEEDSKVMGNFEEKYTGNPLTGAAMCTLGECYPQWMFWHHGHRIPKNYMCCRSGWGHYYCRLWAFVQEGPQAPDLSLQYNYVKLSWWDQNPDLIDITQKPAPGSLSTMMPGELSGNRSLPKPDRFQAIHGKKKCKKYEFEGKFDDKELLEGAMSIRIGRERLKTAPCQHHWRFWHHCAGIPRGYNCCGWGHGLYCGVYKGDKILEFSPTRPDPRPGKAWNGGGNQLREEPRRIFPAWKPEKEEMLVGWEAKNPWPYGKQREKMKWWQRIGTKMVG